MGAENRYDYTVIRDPVNEAARSADHAKRRDYRTLASGSPIARADPIERRDWVLRGSTVRRGRSIATELAEPLTAGSAPPPPWHGDLGHLLMDNIRYPRIGGSTSGTRGHHPDPPIARRAPRV
jgi:hypothetical protein